MPGPPRFIGVIYGHPDKMHTGQAKGLHYDVYLNSEAGTQSK